MPSRTAERAQSIAVLPPPTTMMSSPSEGGLPFATNSRNSIPESASSSPSQRSPCARCAPIARKTASWLFRSSASVKCSPQRMPMRNSAPSCRMAWISASSASLGSRYAGIPYRSMPPGADAASNRVQACPFCRRKYAAASPAGPAPTMATDLPVAGARGGT